MKKYILLIMFIVIFIPCKVLAAEIPIFELNNYTEGENVSGITLTQAAEQTEAYTATINNIRISGGDPLNGSDKLGYFIYNVEIDILNESSETYIGDFKIRHENWTTTLDIDGTTGTYVDIRVKASADRHNVIIDEFNTNIKNFYIGKTIRDIDLETIETEYEILNFLVLTNGDNTTFPDNVPLENKKYNILVEVDTLGHQVASDAKFKIGNAESSKAPTINEDIRSYNVVLTPEVDKTLLGNAEITGTPVFDSILTASLINGNSTNLEYVWKRGNTVISGATSNTYKLTKEDIGEKITVEITSTDKTTGKKSITMSNEVTKADNLKTPDVPIFKKKNNAEIHVEALQGYEYSIDDITWNTTGIFNVTTKGSYNIHARYAETDTHFASTTSTSPSIELSNDSDYQYLLTVIDGTGTGFYKSGEEVTITANKKPNKTFKSWNDNPDINIPNLYSTKIIMINKSITISPSYKDGEITSIVITPDTASVRLGYTKEFNVNVTGSDNINLDYNWSISGNTSPNTNVDVNNVLRVSNSEALDTVTITATSKFDNSMKDSVVVTILKLNNSQVPDAPVLKRMSNTKLEVVTKSGLEYSIDGTNWNESGIFNVTGETDYDVLARVKETSHVEPSAPSVPLHITITNSVEYVYKLIVINGDGSGYYPLGENINIQAHEINNKIFKKWTISDGSTSNDKNLSFSMPDKAITITAVYEDIKVTKVEITPALTQFEKGKEYNFIANVTTNDSNSKLVNWTLEGNDNNGTKIDSNGKLTVADDEISKKLIIIATSAVDTDIKDSIELNLKTSTKPVIKPAEPKPNYVAPIIPEKEEEKEEDKDTEKVEDTYITSDDDILITKGDNKDISISFNNEIKESIKLELNGETVSSSNYEISSKLLTLKDNYVGELPEGNNEFTLFVGEEKINFTINVEGKIIEEKEEKDKTNNNLIYFIVGLFISLIAIFFLTKKKA